MIRHPVWVPPFRLTLCVLYAIEYDDGWVAARVLDADRAASKIPSIFD